MQVFRLVVLFVWNYFPCGRVKGEKRFCMGGIGATYFPHLEIECPPRTCFGVMKHNEKKFSTPTIRCDLSIATRDEKMHRWIILVVNPRFLVADGSHLFNHRLVWALIFFIFKKKTKLWWSVCHIQYDLRATTQEWLPTSTIVSSPLALQ